jgi:hypothetical protein
MEKLQVQCPSSESPGRRAGQLDLPQLTQLMGEGSLRTMAGDGSDRARAPSEQSEVSNANELGLYL